jgi:hypothetical protein
VLYPVIANSETLVIATPLYIPLAGDMQNLLNRLCPLSVPIHENREGRIMARFRGDVKVRHIGINKRLMGVGQLRPR